MDGDIKSTWCININIVSKCMIAMSVGNVILITKAIPVYNVLARCYCKIPLRLNTDMVVDDLCIVILILSCYCIYQ